jgi:hypothetical protein
MKCYPVAISAELCMQLLTRFIACWILALSQVIKAVGMLLEAAAE